MAIIKAINHNSTLSRIIRYITHADKTTPELIGGFNLDPANALEEMTATKKQWNKTGGRLYKHFVQSFDADTVSAAQANQIAWDFVQQTPLFRGHEVLFATHTDREHIHTHFIVNSVSYEDGHKLRYAAPVLDEMKEISDKVLREHGLQTECPGITTENVTAWKQELYQLLCRAHDGKVSSWVYDTAAAVIDAMENCHDKEAFTQQLRQAGYQVNWRGSGITFTVPNGKKIRASRLENLFKLPSVLERFEEPAAVLDTLRKDLHKAAAPSRDADMGLHKAPLFERALPALGMDGQFRAWREENEKRQTLAPFAALPVVHVSTQRMATAELQREIDAAAYVYGSALCQGPEHLEELLARSGYRWDKETRTITTPMGRHFRILNGQPPDTKAETIFSFQKEGELVRSSCKETFSPAKDEKDKVISSIAEGIAAGDSLPEFLMRITRCSKETIMDWNDPGRSEIVLQSSYTLDDLLKAAGLPVMDQLYPAHQQQPVSYKFTWDEEPAKAADSVMPAADKKAADRRHMEMLLSAVREAVSASTREEFTEAMNAAGYTLRWTQNGTLTFINPNGERIRASRLEKKYHLPPITAAYGQQKPMPAKGERPQVAEAVRSAAQCSTTRQEFARVMAEKGYAVQWNSSKTDAVITTEGGQHIRLSTLTRQFDLPTGGIDGIQHEESTGGEAGRLDQLREAAARAADSLQRGRAGLSDRRTGSQNPGSERRTDAHDAAASAGDGSAAAKTAMRERADREAGRERSRAAAEQEQQCRSQQETHPRSRDTGRSAKDERSSRNWDMER